MRFLLSVRNETHQFVYLVVVVLEYEKDVFELLVDIAVDLEPPYVFDVVDYLLRQFACVRRFVLLLELCPHLHHLLLYLLCVLLLDECGVRENREEKKSPEENNRIRAMDLF